MDQMIERMISRHAIRRYQQRQVEEELLEQVLLAGLYAPSAGNNQLSRIVVCQDREVNEKLGRLSREMQFQGRDPKKASHPVSAEQPSIQDDFTIQSGFYGAPTVLHLFTRPGPYAHDDAAAMGENLLLAAHFLGLGACYIGRAGQVFATEYGRRLREDWGVPPELEAVCHVTLGYREGPEPHAKPRREGRILRV